MGLTRSHPPTTIERPPTFNDFRGGSGSYTAMNCSALLLNWVFHGQSFQYVLVYNFTNMHAMSHRADFFPCSCSVNIWEPAICFTVSLLSVVFRVGLPSHLIATAMLDSQSYNTSLLEVMISCKNERVLIRDLRGLMLQIIFDAWWASMNNGSKLPIPLKNPWHTPSWPFYLHCGIEETGSPGIICIICHQVLRHPSEHGTSSMEKHLLAKAHIAKLDQLAEFEVTELTSSTVDETALAILNRQGSRGITIVSSQRNIIFDIQVDRYGPKWQTKRSKLVAKDFETSEFHQDTWDRHLMVGFVSVHIPWIAISNLELQQSYQALRDDLVLPSTTTLRNIGRREYALTVDAIKKQLLSWSNVNFALNGWTPPNKLAITSVFAYYMDRNRALCEAQLAFKKGDRLLDSHFEIKLRMIDQEPPYWV